MTRRLLPLLSVAVMAAACGRPMQPRVSSVPSSTIDASIGDGAPVFQQGAPRASANSAAANAAVVESAHVPAAVPVLPEAADPVVAAPAIPTVAVDATAVTAPPPSWDIEVRSYESTDRVGRYVRLFSGPARERVESRLVRGTRYEAMIRTKLREGGLPEDMYYLAFVESGFDPNAYSRAAAVGMWQFMTSTARDVGLRVDRWVDERRDPIRSTDAAVRFLKDLNDQFGSAYLAAAAYNGGPRRISRGLTLYADELEGTGDDRFFALADKDYLKNETRDYVPQLIAAALIAKEPARYGMTLTLRAPITYDSVRVPALTPLGAVANAAGAQIGDVQELNPHLLRGLTPPNGAYYVRVPTGSADGFEAAFDALPKTEKTGVTHEESKKGESVASIARKAGVSASLIEQFNPGLEHLKSGNLAPGQSLLIPTALVAAAAVIVPDPAIERYSSPPKSSKAAGKAARVQESTGKPAKATRVDKPTNSEKSTKSSKPGKSAKSAKSAKPATTKESAKSAKPAKSAKTTKRTSKSSSSTAHNSAAKKKKVHSV